MKYVRPKVFYCVVMAGLLGGIKAEESSTEVPTTYREWSDLLPDDFDGTFQDDQKTEQPDSNNDSNLTVEQYVTDLDNAARKAFDALDGDLIFDSYDDTSPTILTSTLKESCNLLEKRAKFWQLQAYKKGLLENNTRVTEEEFTNALQSMGLSDQEIKREIQKIEYNSKQKWKLPSGCPHTHQWHHQKREISFSSNTRFTDRLKTLWDNTWYGKVAISGALIIAFCSVAEEIYSYYKKHCAEQKQKKQLGTSVTTQEINENAKNKWATPITCDSQECTEKRKNKWNTWVCPHGVEENYGQYRFRACPQF